MTRRLICGLVILAAMAVEPRAETSPILQRFFAIDDPTPQSYRALRHLEAENGRFDSTAWMDVWTEADASGFRYQIVAEEGSDSIRTRVFRETLKSERGMWASGAPDHAGFTSENYVFEDRGSRADGLAWLIVKPRRKDVLLVDGSIFLDPHDGDLVRLEGRLSKSPSFWARHVDIVRRYRRIAGVRMPVSLESVASVLIAGTSTFRMTYEYETINGHRVGDPQPRRASYTASR
ncbi:MAG TPA: hypothetical protein VKH42_20695 [Vicinamibacterales bacterium]|nr:hypothetical protein [Vicinamibacterales bacterium]